MTANKNINDDTVITATRNWVEQIIIGLEFCPFAKREFLNNRVCFQVSCAQNLEDCLHTLIYECQRLDNNPDIETTLLIFPDGMQIFDDFLDLTELANALLTDSGYEGIYQLAHFHPDYCFEGSDDSDPANYTNRSPWPTLHLIREASLEKVLEHYPEPEKIPEKNIERAREMGINKLKALLGECSGK